MDLSRIVNSSGQPIVLNEREKRVVQINQMMTNALGYEINITTLTTLLKQITEQKFFEIMPADYMPVVAGEGAWSQDLRAYRSFALGDDFGTGIIDTGGQNGRLASANTGVDSINVPVKNWAKEIGWTLFDLELASKSGNWDLITSLEQSRKTNWDLGIQKTAFLGLSGDAGVTGLLNQSGVTVDTTTLTQSISSLSTVDLKAFCANILNVYRSNCSRTAWPTHFIIPETDFLGLAAPASADFPIRSTLSLLEETFQVMTKKKDFKILPCAYADAGAESGGAAYNQYTLLNYDPKSLRFNIPVDYTNTLANSTNNFSFQNVGYGQFTGLMLLRSPELYYLRYNP